MKRQRARQTDKGKESGREGGVGWGGVVWGGVQTERRCGIKSQRQAVCYFVDFNVSSTAQDHRWAGKETETQADRHTDR